MSTKRSGLLALLVLGVVSALLYFGLYLFNDDILSAAQAVRNGDKSLFLMPIALAFVFSYVHGEFTSRFWHYLGVEAKKK